eukprot:scaffold170256_cov18-Tisochrysis_lutea.AAC.1
MQIQKHNNCMIESAAFTHTAQQTQQGLHDVRHSQGGSEHDSVIPRVAQHFPLKVFQLQSKTGQKLSIRLQKWNECCIPVCKLQGNPESRYNLNIKRVLQKSNPMSQKCKAASATWGCGCG